MLHQYRKALLGPKAAELYREHKRKENEVNRSKRSTHENHPNKKHKRNHIHSRRYRYKDKDWDWDLFQRGKRAPKMGASTSVRQRNNLKSIRRKEGGGRGRGKKTGNYDPELGILEEEKKKPKMRLPCEVISSEPFVNIEFVKHGKDPNITFSHGTVIRVACGKGYVLNMEINSTAKCVKGKWKPEKPTCSIRKKFI